MGKIKAWLMDMEEDATVLSRSEWLGKHGSNHESIFDRIQKEKEEIGQGELNLGKGSSDV
jgi:capsid protein|tara:strand:+ start:86 stop:265 length:180 start_codon:yes stop_codon:yes gene_type:complete